MIQIIQKISVEVSKPNFFQAIVAKQYDSNSRFLKVTLIQDNEKINVANTSTVTINAKRNDGAEKSFAGEVNEDGTVTVPLTYWMLELNGTLECDISIFGADESKLTSTKFTVEVERASCQGGDVTDADKCDIVILQGQNIVGSVNGKTGVVKINATDVGAIPASEIADFIVEQGVVGDWTYRKWFSGIVECWGVFNTTYSTTLVDGGNYAVTSDVIRVDLSENLFTKSPIVELTPMGGGYPAIVIANVYNTLFTFTIRTEWAVNNLPIWLQVRCIGSWK